MYDDNNLKWVPAAIYLTESIQSRTCIISYTSCKPAAGTVSWHLTKEVFFSTQRFSRTSYFSPNCDTWLKDNN